MNRAKHPARSITDVAGIEVGHFIEPRRPGTRQTDLLHPSNLVDRVHAIKLAGGSAWRLGLNAANGVMQWLEKNHIGVLRVSGWRPGWATSPSGLMPVPVIRFAWQPVAMRRRAGR